MALDAGVRDMQHLTDGDMEYLEHLAAAAGDALVQFVREPRSRVRFVGEPHRLPRQAHTFTGAHGTMGVIDIVEFDVDVPSSQPNPPGPTGSVTWGKSQRGQSQAAMRVQALPMSAVCDDCQRLWHHQRQSFWQSFLHDYP